MSLLRRRMMQENTSKELFDINAARTDAWRNVVYTIQDGALTITSASYMWTSVYYYLDNCKEGKTYQISFRISTEREVNPSCLVDTDGTKTNGKRTDNPQKITFTCGEETPILYLYWSNSSNETLPITYYDIKLEEV